MAIIRNKHPSDFDPIRIPSQNLTVLFGKSSLEEGRGVGQVTRLLYDQFKSLQGEGKTDNTVTFFPFFTDAPSYPLKNSVVVIHDFSVIEMPEFSKNNRRYVEELKQVCTLCSHIVVCNPDLREKIYVMFGIEPSKITYIPNPIVTDPELIEVDGIPEEPFMLHACAGNQYKNIEVLFKAWSILGQDAPQLVVTGRAYEHSPLIDDLVIRDKITFLDRQPRGKIEYLMQKAEGLLLPSRSEGFTMALLEATSVETTSIIATGNGLQTVLDPDEAFFCDPDDPEQWAKAVRQLHTSGDAGRVRRLLERLKRQQNLSVTAERYLKVFKSLTNPN